MRLKFHNIIFLFVFLILAIPFSGTCVTISSNSRQLVRVESGISYVVDTNHTYTFQDIQSGKYAYTDFPKGTLNFGSNSFAYWLKFSVKNETNTPQVMLSIANAAIDSITIFDSTLNGTTNVLHLGESQLFSKRPHPSANFIVPINIAPNTEKTIYIKVSTSDPLLVPLIVGKPEPTLLQEKYTDIFWGLYIGLMVAMFLYNLFIFFVTRDSDYIFYVFYVLTVLVTQINISGYAYQFLWPNAPQIALFSPFFTPFFSGCASIAFTRRFLHTKTYTPKLDKIFLVIYALYFIGFSLSFFGKFDLSLAVINITALIVSFLILTVAIRIVYLRYRPAAYFLIAWSVFLLGIFVYIFVSSNVLPFNNFTIYMMPVGSAMEVLLLSFALADKINTLKKEKAISQAHALREAEKNSQLIRSQNVLLETKVKERTLELATTNQELNITLSDLKGAQAQLVESEKMASLGQLTAGIAHEINNPINFVISNVKPLKRDVAMLLDVFTQVEALFRNNVSDAEVVKVIDRIKEEIEYDYLTTEIDFLLKGISEGSERTAEIVKGLRIFARVDEDDLKITNIHDGIDSTITIVNALLTDKISVEKQYGPVSTIECFPGKLNQALLNIISNGIHAIKAKFKEQQGGKINIRTWADENTFHISIKDNGCGMPEEVKNRIFEPFYSTKDVGEGTGLGLSIVYNIIKKHAGIIIVDSKIGVGTEFILSIPINQHFI